MSGDLWATPPEICQALDSEFGFGVDICASHTTAKCPIYFTEENDSLSMDWAKEFNPTFGKWIWCNPPYSKIGPWVTKAVDSQFNGVGVVMLVMCDPSVGWFSDALAYASEIRFVTNGRLAFLENGQPKSGNNKGSVIFVFDPHRIGSAHTVYVERAALIAKGQRLIKAEAA